MSKIVSVNHKDLFLRTFMLFIQLANATVKFADSRFYRSNRLSMMKFIALKVLVLSGGSMTHSQMARWTNTKKHNITTLVERMKQEQFVTTQRSSEDKRVIDIIITKKGREVFTKASPVARSIMEQLMLGIDESDAGNFEIVLSTIKENIERN